MTALAVAVHMMRKKNTSMPLKRRAGIMPFQRWCKPRVQRVVLILISGRSENFRLFCWSEEKLLFQALCKARNEPQSSRRKGLLRKDEVFLPRPWESGCRGLNFQRFLSSLPPGSPCRTHSSLRLSRGFCFGPVGRASCRRSRTGSTAL